jgi:hypothetical protein
MIWSSVCFLYGDQARTQGEYLSWFGKSCLAIEPGLALCVYGDHFSKLFNS